MKEVGLSSLNALFPMPFALGFALCFFLSTCSEQFGTDERIADNTKLEWPEVGDPSFLRGLPKSWLM